MVPTENNPGVTAPKEKGCKHGHSGSWWRKVVPECTGSVDSHCSAFQLCRACGLYGSRGQGEGTTDKAAEVSRGARGLGGWVIGATLSFTRQQMAQVSLPTLPLPYINRSTCLLLSNSLAFPTLPKQNGQDARFEQIFSTFLVSLWQAPEEGSVASEAGLSEGDWKRKGTLALSSWRCPVSSAAP